MSFYPETDRASTWVALVMIGFMAVSVLVWVLGRSPGEGVETPATEPNPAAAAPAAPAAAQQTAGQPTAATQPAQPPAPASAASAATLPASLPGRPNADIPPPQFAQASQTSAGGAAPQQQTPAAAPQPDSSSAAPAAAQPAAAVAPAPTPYPPSPRPTPLPQQTRPAGQDGAPSASGLARGLRARGHRVHASVSGEGRSLTLSVSGATLTRDAGVEWLGNSSTRQELKSAGIRVVVISSGQGSWTFML